MNLTGEVSKFSRPVMHPYARSGRMDLAPTLGGEQDSRLFLLRRTTCKESVLT